MLAYETLEGLKENIYLTKDDLPYILLIIAQELRDKRELRENELFGVENEM